MTTAILLVVSAPVAVELARTCRIALLLCALRRLVRRCPGSEHDELCRELAMGLLSVVADSAAGGRTVRRTRREPRVDAFGRRQSSGRPVAGDPTVAP
ncbi:hypothetical protein [Streptomyces nondiastaticus]|uniref:Secreted protein n=1 Tax=Streptomyces nondiastaticus TaxID=3154512 RepID=A0ABW6TUQ5_9ACTN